MYSSNPVTRDVETFFAFEIFHQIFQFLADRISTVAHMLQCSVRRRRLYEMYCG